jgi:hypothetical protein
MELQAIGLKIGIKQDSSIDMLRFGNLFIFKFRDAYSFIIKNLFIDFFHP